MNSPFYHRRTITPEFAEAWRAYETKARAAAEQYEDLPIAHCHAGEGSTCRQCHRRATRARDGVCPVCKRGEA